MSRPLGVAILAIIFFLIGLVEVLHSFLRFGPPIMAFPFAVTSPASLVFPVYFIIGLIWMFVAYSFWKGAEIGLLIGMIISALVIVLDFPIGTVLGFIVLFYLVVPNGVRTWFSRPGLRKWIYA